jgi:hypothetical protein
MSIFGNSADICLRPLPLVNELTARRFRKVLTEAHPQAKSFSGYAYVTCIFGLRFTRTRIS